MMYQGGKSRIAKDIAEVINAVHRREIPDSGTNSADPHRPGKGGGTPVLSVCFAAVVP